MANLFANEAWKVIVEAPTTMVNEMKQKTFASLEQEHKRTEATATEIKLCDETSSRSRGITPTLFSFSESCRNKFKPGALKLTIVRNIGQILTRLKRVGLVRKIANMIRFYFPWVWGVLIKMIRPFYWAYQASTLDDSDDASFKDTAAFNEQQRQKKLLRKHTYNSYLISTGVMNNRPVVDPVVILERINRALS